MRYEKGWSHRDAFKETGMPQATYYKYLRIGKESLHKLLKSV
jgi:hypothetical protein